jgi:hypothetical protein
MSPPYKSAYGLSRNITIIARKLEGLRMLFRARFNSGALSCVFGFDSVLEFC